MEPRRLRWGTVLGSTALAATLLLCNCRDQAATGTPPADPPAQQTGQIEQEVQELVFDDVEIPTTPESVHVRPDEFEVSGPYTHANLDVFLVHSRKQRQPKRKILTLAEALTQKKVKVHETEQVEELAIENLTTDTDIYVQSGDIVRGGKQDRVLAVDLLVRPKSGKMPIASFCVEQGRWNARSGELSDNEMIAADFDSNQWAASGSTALFSSSDNVLSSKELKKAVKLAKNQQAVWKNVSLTQVALKNRLGVEVRNALSASSLELTLSNDTVQKAAAKYQKTLGKILEGKEYVVGYAFAINGKMNSAEVYSSGDLFAKLWNKMLQATAVEAVCEADTKTVKTKPITTDTVRAFLSVAKSDKAEGRTVNGRVQLVTVEGDEIAFSETRDKEAGAAWVHRSYLAK